MALFLEGTEGPADGQKFRLEPGVRVGRSTGEIILVDPKVSALHAQVEGSEKGQLFLVDRDSSNGLKISGKRVKRVALLPGVRIQIGRSLFKVVEIFAEPVRENSFAGADGWRRVLHSQIPKLSSRNQSHATLVQKFDPILELAFLEGIQFETKLVLGYGPRKAGADVLDIELQDPASPDVAFELLPEGDGIIRFRTPYPNVVLFNGAHVSSDILETGDRIQIGSTLIEVRFLT
jgi:pSer/pThr/pTyr-binding forkhead associated (FHA) protein